MPRGKLSPEIKKQRALKAAEEFMGQPLELPAESFEDKMREAQSVINYFEVKGAGFRKQECRNCGQIFAYSYHIDGIKHCSVECTVATLKKMGLTWDPSRPVERRWGSYAPAVVPPSVLGILQDLIDTQESQPHSTCLE